MDRNYSVTIVTLCCNKFNLTNDFLSDLMREKENIDEIIVVDNGSDEETVGGLEWWRTSSELPVKVKRFDENLGFTMGSNIGLRLATENRQAERRIIFLISNDVQISGKFIQQTADILFDPKRSLVGAKLLTHDTGWNTFDGTVFPYLEGYFIAATVDGWIDLNYFDENYAPFDYEDVDLSATARKKGYKLVPLNNPYIHHVGGGTLGYNPERENITRRNREYFRKKWTE